MLAHPAQVLTTTAAVQRPSVSVAPGGDEPPGGGDKGRKREQEIGPVDDFSDSEEEEDLEEGDHWWDVMEEAEFVRLYAKNGKRR